MFLTGRGGYRNGEQVASGLFLILMTCDDAPLDQIRAIVRPAGLHQLGHFMMGSARINGKRIPLSGAYGGDGLTRTVSRDVYLRGVPLPAPLYDAWNKGEGWNDAGREAPSMRAWALSNLAALRAPKPRPRKRTPWDKAQHAIPFGSFCP